MKLSKLLNVQLLFAELVFLDKELNGKIHIYLIHEWTNTFPGSVRIAIETVHTVNILKTVMLQTGREAIRICGYFFIAQPFFCWRLDRSYVH